MARAENASNTIVRHFAGRETATFSTVRKYKEVSVSFNFKNIYIFPTLFRNTFFNGRKKYTLLEFQTVEK